MRAPAVPPITDPAAAPRPRPRMAPPAAPPAAPIAVFLARRLPRLRVFRGFVLLEVVAALATGTTPSAKSPTDIRAARMDFLITKLLTNLRRKTVAKALLFRHTLDRTRKLSVACGGYSGEAVEETVVKRSRTHAGRNPTMPPTSRSALASPPPTTKTNSKCDRHSETLTAGTRRGSLVSPSSGVARLPRRSRNWIPFRSSRPRRSLDLIWSG